MPHSRKRHATELLLKKLRFAPITAIQGARQTGKSFLVRELLKSKLPKLSYVSLDQPSKKAFALSNPETLLDQHSDAAPLVIDEAQKAPPIFDALKHSVDQRRIPGRFLILGSTEFSKLTLIRESLTGRMSRLRLYSMNQAEALELPPNPSRKRSLLNETPRATRTQLLHHLDRGGMPGIFATRDPGERENLLRDWLDLTTQRDALLFPKVRIDPDLCRMILKKVATLEEPDAGSIAKVLRKDLRRIKTHLEVLTSLFVLHPLPPHPAGTGKTQFFLCDVSFARILGADFERQLYTWLLQEQLSQRAYRDDRDSKLFFYRTPKGRRVHLLVEDKSGVSAIKIFPEERVLERDITILKALTEKFPNQELELAGVASSRYSFPIGNRTRAKVELYPWESAV